MKRILSIEDQRNIVAAAVGKAVCQLAYDGWYFDGLNVRVYTDAEMLVIEEALKA